MKLCHLLQKCSFFLIKLAAFQASGGWIKQRTAFLTSHEAPHSKQSLIIAQIGRFSGQR
jgi:hypothetical protein